MSAGSLPTELLDGIFSRLAPVYRRKDNTHKFPSIDLISASLTCRAWRVPAQRRLLHTVTLREKSDLERLSAWLEATGHDGAYFTVLAITLYNWDLCRQKHLTPTMLQHWLNYFPNLRELHVETHLSQADPTLVSFLSSFTTIHTLSVIYGHHEDRYPDEYDSDDEEPDECSCCPDLWLDPGAFLATAPHLLSSVLPSLPRLRHLYLSYFNFFEAEMPSRLKSQITHFCLVKCAFRDWIFDSVVGQNARNLRHLALAQPILSPQNNLARELARFATSLERLVIICEWQSVTSLGVQSAGVAPELLPLCTNLRELYIDDPQMHLSLLDNSPHLHTLRVTKIPVHEIDAHRQTSGKNYRRISLHSLSADTHVLGEYQEKWSKCGWDILLDYNWFIWVNRHFKDFLARLPDPVL